jgi:hypothetical protein
VAFLGRADGDAARLGLLRDRDAQGQHSGLIARLDAVCVEGVTEEQLPGEESPGSLRDLQLDVVTVLGGDYARAFAAIASLQPQALIVGAQAVLLRDRKQVIALAAKYRLPASYEWPSQVRDGGLMSYGANDVETYKQVAIYIERIFKGARAGDLPVWQPHKLHLVKSSTYSVTDFFLAPSSLAPSTVMPPGTRWNALPVGVILRDVSPIGGKAVHLSRSRPVGHVRSPG